MSFNAIVGSFTQPTSTGNQAVTGVGFHPKVVLFFMNQLTADGNTTDGTSSFGVGVSSSDRRYISMSVKDGRTTTYSGRRQDDVNCIGCITANSGSAPTTNCAADLVSMDSDGFTVNWGTVDATQRIVNYLALGGNDLISVKSGAFDSPGSTGDFSVTGVGFRPDTLIIFNENNATIPGSSSTSIWGIGFVDDGGTIRSFHNDMDASASLTALAGGSQTEIIDTFGHTATFVSYDSDGFTINVSNVDSTKVHYLAMKGLQSQVGQFTQKTSAGSQATSGLGFQPKALILMSTDSTFLSDTTPARFSIGAATSSSARFSMWCGSTHNANPGSSDSDLDRANVIKMMVEGTPTTNATADFTSFDSDGFTLNWGTADASARIISYWALGNSTLTSNIKTFNGVTEDNADTVNRLARGLVKTANGLT